MNGGLSVKDTSLGIWKSATINKFNKQCAICDKRKNVAFQRPLLLISRHHQLITMNTRNFILLVLSIWTNTCALGQEKQPSNMDVLEKFRFEEYLIILEEDTTFFYHHQKPNSNPSYLVLYLQGTSPDPLFSVEKEKGKFTIYRWFPGDYKLLDENYAYAIIGKSGIPPIKRTEDENYDKYHQVNTLDYRVEQADTVINFILEKVMDSAEKIIVYGHSEGAPVAAKLGTINKKITHLGFWAGNALPDFYDFALFSSNAAAKGEISNLEAKENVEELIEEFQKVSKNRNSTKAESKDDYSDKRWWSYAEPPINNLLKIDIPIYVQVAGNDQSAPIQSTYLIPFEFIRHGKTNLTYDICAECDHGFVVNEKDMWNEVFVKFITWTNKD